MSSKSRSPPVRRLCTICCSQVVPHLAYGAMITSVGRGTKPSPALWPSDETKHPIFEYSSSSVVARRDSLPSIVCSGPFIMSAEDRSQYVAVNSAQGTTTHGLKPRVGDYWPKSAHWAGF